MSYKLYSLGFALNQIPKTIIFRSIISSESNNPINIQRK